MNPSVSNGKDNTLLSDKQEGSGESSTADTTEEDAALSDIQVKKGLCYGSGAPTPLLKMSQLQPLPPSRLNKATSTWAARTEGQSKGEETPLNYTTTDTAVNPTDKGDDTARRSQNDVLSNGKGNALLSDKQASLSAKP